MSPGPETTVDQSPPPVTAQECAQNACTRRVEWRMTALDADGAVLLTVLACNSFLHRGQATAAARRVCGGAVQIRRIDEEALR